MNVGATSMDAPAAAAAGALGRALDTQASLAGALIEKGTGQQSAMAAQAAAEQGKGTQLDMMA